MLISDYEIRIRLIYAVRIGREISVFRKCLITITKAFAAPPDTTAVDGLRLLFYAAMQSYIVQSITAKNASKTPFYAKTFLPASSSLTSSAVGKSIAR